MSFKLRAASSVALLAATVAEIGASSPTAASPSASATASADIPGALPGMGALAAMSGHKIP